MRVVVMHNPTAGDERHATDELVALVRDGGHDVVRVATRRGELALALEAGCDLVAVAGGDGTVAKAARIVAGTDVPLALIPAGTANNMARTLGLHDHHAVDALVAGWSRSATWGFDAADVTWRGGGCRVFEAFGLGAFPRAMNAAERSQRDSPAADAAAALRRDRELLRAAVIDTPPRAYRVDVDGTDHSGSYLLVELMLMPYVGPNLRLAPQVNPHDGLIDVVLVGEDERAALVDEIDALVRGETVRWSPSSVRGRRVTIEMDEGAQPEASHADGDLCLHAGRPVRGPYEVVSLPDAFRMLVPDAGGA